MIALVLGGTRSGKSEVAESLVARLGTDRGLPVTYLATAQVGDDDHAARIDAHRRRRPAAWTTVECGGDLAGALGRAEGVVLVDSLGTWLLHDPDLRPDVGPVLAALRARSAPTVLVSEEVGLSLHAPTELGRRFADELGRVNRVVADVADHALLVVAGRAIALPPPGELPC